MKLRLTLVTALGVLASATGGLVGAVGAGTHAGSTTSGAIGSPVTVRMTFTNDGSDVKDGDVASFGHFIAKGAIRDRGKLVVYRWMDDGLITLRFVVTGTKGNITFVVKIDTTAGTSRWTIASGTRKYRALHGRGIERENASYTVSTLTGKVWR